MDAHRQSHGLDLRGPTWLSITDGGPTAAGSFCCPHLQRDAVLVVYEHISCMHMAHAMNDNNSTPPGLSDRMVGVTVSVQRDRGAAGARSLRPPLTARHQRSILGPQCGEEARSNELPARATWTPPEGQVASFSTLR